MGIPVDGINRYGIVIPKCNSIPILRVLKMKANVSLSAISCAVLLAACGGGGGTSNTGTTPPPAPATCSNGATDYPTCTPPVVKPDPNALQDTVPSSTYVPASLLAAAYTTLNTARQAYGAGLLSQNAKLDTAASNHAKYASQRYSEKDFANIGHTEDAAKSGFTGVSPADRIVYAGYAAASVGEDMTTFISVDGVSSDPGVIAVSSLLSAPYHRFGLFEGNRDIGIGSTSARFTGEGGVNNTVVIDMGVAQGAQQQLPARSWVGVWPINGAENVMYSFAGESPNPIPVNNGACAGYPVSVQVRNGLALSTTSFTMTDAAGVVVNVQLSTAATDVNPSQARANTAYIIPFKPLKLATKYTVRFVGAANGAAIDKTWSFVTTNQNQKLIYGCDPS